MSRNIRARQRMSLAERRRTYRDLTFNKAGPDLRWRQHFRDHWDIIWPSSINDDATTPEWHPLLDNGRVLDMFTDEMFRHAYIVDHGLAYGEGDFENKIQSAVYNDAVPRVPVSRVTRFDGFDVSRHGPYALDWRHGPEAHHEDYPEAEAHHEECPGAIQLLWRVRRPWWVV